MRHAENGCGMIGPPRPKNQIEKIANRRFGVTILLIVGLLKTGI